MKELTDEEKKLKEKIYILQEEIKKNYEKLKEIAINYSSYQTKIEFLKELNKKKKRSRTEGFEKRIEQYKKMIEENENVLKNI